MIIIFDIVVASKVFTFTFCCTMPWQAPDGDPLDIFKDVAVSCTVRLWYCGKNGFLRVNPGAVINIPPGYGKTSTTIQTPEREVFPITVSWLGRLIGVDEDWLNSGFCRIHCVSPEWVHDTCPEFYRPLYFSQQQNLIHRTYHQIPYENFPKWSSQ